MGVDAPTLEELRQLADRYHLGGMSAKDLAELAAIIDSSLDAARRVDELEDPGAPPATRGRTGRAPTPEENPLNAWVWRSEIKETDSGPLAGKTIAFKDNVAVAGLPMRNGTALLDGYVPDEDATIVSRALAAGATVVGKAACEHMSFSGSSYTAASGTVLNPHDPTRTSGGSSSGSGALVASGAVDIANGGDQAGSIRIPASFSGCYGLKPSYGLVPSTGVFPIDITADHVGALAATVEDIALFLDAVAGEDPLDPRQRVGWGGWGALPNYRESLTGNVSDLRIGVLDEGFGFPESEAEVDDSVRYAADKFAGWGATVGRASIPLHREGLAINISILLEGGFATMLRGNGAGTNWKGRYPLELMETLGAARAERANEMSDVMKVLTLAGEYLTNKYHSRIYGKAQNLALALTAAYDRALQEFDLLIMPSTPMRATALPTADLTRAERYELVLNMCANTAPTCVTGHPAVSVPCARVDGLPVGMMIVGRHGDDATVLRAAHVFEKSGLYGPVVPERFRRP